VHSRKITRIAALFLIFAYLPILAGGGECVVLCVSSEGGLALDYTHTCGASHHDPAQPVNEKHAALSGWHHHGFHHDIPIFSGNANLSMPGIAQDAGRAAPDTASRVVSTELSTDRAPVFHTRFHLKIPSESYRCDSLTAVLII